MEIQVAYFTEKGKHMGEYVFGKWKPEQVTFRDKCNEVDLKEWARLGFERRRAIVFIGATGIAVRSIAPFVENKLFDSPVLVIDELGTYVIPLLSGHVGGANELAKRIANVCGAQPVITTATDLNHKFAVDMFAKKNKLCILKKDGIAKVSAKILRGEKVSIYIEGYEALGERHLRHQISGTVVKLPEELVWFNYDKAPKAEVVVSTDLKLLDKAVMPLYPRQFVLGIGCKKGKLYTDIIKQITESNINMDQIACIASIDRKADEQGIIELANRNCLEYLTFSAEELQKVEGEFHTSEFVKAQVGVDNVCERAALLAAGAGAELYLHKCVGNGITLALAKRRWEVKFDEA